MGSQAAPAQQHMVHETVSTATKCRGEEGVRKAQGRWREGLGHLSAFLTIPMALFKRLSPAALCRGSALLR